MFCGIVDILFLSTFCHKWFCKINKSGLVE